MSFSFQKEQVLVLEDFHFFSASLGSANSCLFSSFIFNLAFCDGRTNFTLCDVGHQPKTYRIVLSNHLSIV
jgi:hypothetical protein